MVGIVADYFAYGVQLFGAKLTKQAGIFTVVKIEERTSDHALPADLGIESPAFADDASAAVHAVNESAFKRGNGAIHLFLTLRRIVKQRSDQAQRQFDATDKGFYIVLNVIAMDRGMGDSTEIQFQLREEIVSQFGSCRITKPSAGYYGKFTVQKRF